MILSNGERQSIIRRNQRIKLITFLGVLVLLIAIIVLVENMLLSSLLAFVMSYLLSPIANRLERTGVPRWLAVTMTFAGVSLFLFGFGFIIFPVLAEQISSFRLDVPKYIEGTTRLLNHIESRINALVGDFYAVNLSEQAEDILIAWTTSLFVDLPRVLSNSLTTLFLAPFIAFFLLKDGRAMTHRLFGLVPNYLFEFTLIVFHQVNDQMGHFIRARLLEALIVGLAVFLGLWAMGFPYAPLIGAFAGLTNLIPYVGPFIGAIPALAIALVNGESALTIGLALGVFGIAQLIDIFLLIPVIVAKIVDLHPLTVVIAIIIGAQLMGVLGMLISIPLASAFKVIFVNLYHHTLNFRA